MDSTREQAMHDEAMSVEDAARFLKVDVWAVESAIEHGQLPSVVLGGETLVPWRRLMRMLDPEWLAA